MSWWHAVLLGALQGVTEFLPISSSGHLVLAQHFLGFEDPAAAPGAALFFDGVLHLGTLLAVVLYFRNGLRQQVQQQLKGPADTLERVWPSSRGEMLHLLMLVGLATLPAALVAMLLGKHIAETFNNPWMVAVDFLILGVILLATDRIRRGSTSGPATTWWQALVVGMGQAVSAVFRGLSRSGMTISAALLVGLERDWAVRFSFMMSVIASLGLGGLGILKAFREPMAAEWLTPSFIGMTLLGTLVSGLVGYATIDLLIRLVRKARLWWFSVYLWIVGAVSLVLLGLGL